MKSIEDVADEIVDGIHKSKARIVKCWNYFFPEEIIDEEIFAGVKDKDLEIKTELLDILKEEIITFEDMDKVKKIYQFATDEEFPELAPEDMSFEDWDEN